MYWKGYGDFDLIQVTVRAFAWRY